MRFLVHEKRKTKIEHYSAAPVKYRLIYGKEPRKTVVDKNIIIHMQQLTIQKQTPPIRPIAA